MLLKLYKMVRQPRRGLRHLATRVAAGAIWESRYRTLREPKVRGPVPHDPEKQLAIAGALRAHGFQVEELDVDVDDYRRFLARARYQRFLTYYEGGRSSGFAEKALEHYLAAQLLGLQSEDVYVDVASLNSPAPRIYRDLYGCTVYRQDLVYPAGLRGDRIGGDAGSMPVPDGFATKIALHNAFEHFEGDSDVACVREAARILRPGGRLCILPLFLFDIYAIQTDPAALPREAIAFEDDAVLYCEKGWCDRHGRFYDVPHLIARIRDNLGDLRLTIGVVRNERAVNPECYLKFVALFEKP